MKPHTLPVKRRPVSKGILKRLSAVTGSHYFISVRTEQFLETLSEDLLVVDDEQAWGMIR